MKIISILLLISMGCTPTVGKQVNLPRCLIVEYTGLVNKPIPILIFCDSSYTISDPDYHQTIILESKMLSDLAACIPQYSETINRYSNPLYKITLAYESVQNITYINSPKDLNLFIDCIEKYITKSDFYPAFEYLESARQ